MVDAVVLWGVLYFAGGIVRHDWDGNFTIISEDGPRRLSVRLDEPLGERWEGLFESYWNEVKFLTIEVSLDLPEEQAADMRGLLGVPQQRVNGGRGAGSN